MTTETVKREAKARKVNGISCKAQGSTTIQTWQDGW